MKIVRRLAVLESSALWIFDRSSKSFPTPGAALSPIQTEAQVTHAMISLLNAWGAFLRAYFVCCALGARSPTARVSSSITGVVLNPNDAVGRAVRHYRAAATPRANGIWDSRDEPRWHDVSVFLHLAAHFTFSNSSDISTALSFGFTAHHDAIVFRNYYAHKNRVTKEKAQAIATKYSISSNIHPTSVLQSSPISAPGLTLFEMWLAEFKQTTSLLCS